MFGFSTACEKSGNSERNEVILKMLCSRCHKRPAVVFLSSSEDAGKTQGLCLTCARELGIKPVNDLIDKMGLTDEQMEAMEDELNDLVNPDGGNTAHGISNSTGKSH